MKFNVIPFTWKKAKKIKTCFNILRKCVYILLKKANRFVKIPLLTLTLYSSFIYAAKDNLYNVTTFAGSGKAAYADGTGTNASFKGPSGITIDPAGNIYVSDRENFVIRKITPSGVVTTLAGTPGQSGNIDGIGKSAKFSLPLHIKHDGSENLYLADYNGGSIKKISTQSGTVTTFSKSTPFAAGIALNSSRNIYVTSSNNNKISQISSNGALTTLAGNGKAGSTNGAATSTQFSYPIGLTTYASNIYVADYNNNLIRKITSTGNVTTMAGSTAAGYANGTSTSAKFKGPTDVASDAAGNLYVTDNGNNLIRKITPTGIVTTIAGKNNTAGSQNGAGANATFNKPYALTIDNAGNIYVAEYNNHLIRKIRPNYIGSGITDTAITNNDYGTEAITLAGGTLKAGTNALNINNNVLFDNNTISNINVGKTGQYIVLGGNVNGSGALIISNGTFVLTKTNPYTGTITINSGAMLQFGLGGSTGSVTSSSIINNGTIQFGTSGTTSCSANISGTGGLWKSISGTLTLTGKNTYTGSTVIDPTPNKQTNAILIGDISTSVGVNIATASAYDLNGINRTLIDPSGAGTIKSSIKNASLTLISQKGSLFSGTIANTISNLIVNGSNKLQIIGINSYTGSTTINTGSTLIGNISQSSPITINGTYDLNGISRTLTNPSGTGTIQSSNKSATVILNSKTRSTFAGTLAKTISGLTKTGSETLVISGINNMPSDTITTINEGGLQIGDGSTNGTITSNTLVNNGMVIFNKSNDYVYPGVISGAGSLIQNGCGKTLLIGANTYAGTTSINAGTLSISSGNNLGSGSIIFNGGILQANSNLTLTQPLNLAKKGTISTLNNSVTIASIITGSNSLIKNDNGTLILTNTNTYTGTTNIKDGTLQIGTGGTTGSIASKNLINNANLTFNRSDTITYSNIISGIGTLTQSGSGTLILTGANTYSGQTIINNGALQIGAGSSTGNITSSSIINNALLSFNRSDAYTYTGVISGSGTLQQLGTGTLTLAGANTYTGATKINTGKTLIGNIAHSNGVTIAGTYDMNGMNRTLIDPSGSGIIQSSTANAELTLTSNNGSIFSGAIANTISKLTINGSKVLSLTGINAYTGVITIAPNSSFIGNTPNAKSITVNGTYDLNGSACTLNNLNGTGTIQSSVQKSTLTINAQDHSTFSGIFANTLNSVIKSGLGTLTLSGAQPYTGEIIVSAGTLELTNKNALSGVITLSEKTTLYTNINEKTTITNPINFNSTTMSDTPATIKVNKPTTFSGPLICNAPPDKTGRLIISGGHPVTLTGKHLGNFAIILSGEGTRVIIKDEANVNTEIVTGSTWFVLNKDKNSL